MSRSRESRRREKFVDPAPARENDASEPRYRRGANDLVVSLGANGRTVRLFTADGETSPPVYYPTDKLGDGLEENVNDR